MIALIKRLVLTSLFIAIAACSDSEAPAEIQEMTSIGLLERVPANTAYVWYNDPKEAIVNPLWDISSLFDVVDDAIEGIKSDLSKNEIDPEAGQLILAFLEELKLEKEQGDLSGIGIDQDKPSVIYGLEWLPVMHVELGDSEAFKAFIQRVEKRAEMQFPIAQFEEKAYYRFGDHEAVFAVYIEDEILSATVLPVGLDAEILPALMGSRLPDTSLKDSDRKSKLSVKLEQGSQLLGAGFIDIQSLGQQLLSSQSELMQFFRKAVEVPEEATTPICQQSYQDLSSAMPEIRGYTAALSDKEIQFSTQVMLQSQLASDLSMAKVPVVGSSLNEAVLLNMIIGIDPGKAVAAARNFIQSYAVTNPGCDAFESFYSDMAEAREKAQQPLPPFSNVVKGVNIQIHDLPDNLQQPGPGAKAALALQVDNPQMLVGMGAAFAPQLAELVPDPEAKPQPVDPQLLQQMGGVLTHAWITMTDSAIGLSTGDGMDQILQKVMTAEADPEQAVFFMEQNAEMLLSIMKKQLEAMPQHKVDPEAMKQIEFLSEKLEKQQTALYFNSEGIELKFNLVAK